MHLKQSPLPMCDSQEIIIRVCNQATSIAYSVDIENADKESEQTARFQNTGIDNAQIVIPNSWSGTLQHVRAMVTLCVPLCPL